MHWQGMPGSQTSSSGTPLSIKQNICKIYLGCICNIFVEYFQNLCKMHRQLHHAWQLNLFFWNPSVDQKYLKKNIWDIFVKIFVESFKIYFQNICKMHRQLHAWQPNLILRNPTVNQTSCPTSPEAQTLQLQI